MQTQKNVFDGDSLILSADDSLEDVPVSHQDLITPEIRKAFADPRGYFRAAADRCEFPKMAQWLRAISVSENWRLWIEEADCYGHRQTQCGFRFWNGGQLGIMVCPPVNANPIHEIEAFAHYYSLVDLVHWEQFGLGGGLLGYGKEFPVDDDQLESPLNLFPHEETFVWGVTDCGDMLIFSTTGQSGFLSHETSTAYSLGTIEEGINWVFNVLLSGGTPEFDYAHHS